MASMPLLRRDDHGDAVATLQQLLGRALGADWAASIVQDGTGQFGPRTYAAVIAFQTQKSLKLIDGKVGSETWGALGVQPGDPLPSAQTPDGNPVPTEEVGVPSWVIVGGVVAASLIIGVWIFREGTRPMARPRLSGYQRRRR